ncbi:CocE/NonD family hydrolase [Staphylococcus aureus]|nr:CocE/NonD family hydrolase [Staphylococcus aureus]
MNQHLLGNPKLTVTHVNEVKAGINHIVVDSVQYGNQEMIMEKDVTVETGVAKWASLPINTVFVGCYMVKTILQSNNNVIDKDII